MKNSGQAERAGSTKNAARPQPYNNKYRLYVTFRQSGFPEIDEYINYFDSKGRSKSNYLLTIFEYSKKHKEQVLGVDKIAFDILKLQYMACRYNLFTQKQISKFLEAMPQEQYPVPVRHERFLFSFDMENKLEMRCFETFHAMTTARASTEILTMIRRYCLSGEDLDYLEYAAKQILSYLKSLNGKKRSDAIENTYALISQTEIETPMTREIQAGILRQIER